MRWLARYPYRSLEQIAKVQARVLIIHSRDDEIVPFHHGQRLYAAAAGPKQFMETYGAHNSGPAARGAEYVAGIEKFLQTALRAGAGVSPGR